MTDQRVKLSVEFILPENPAFASLTIDYSENNGLPPKEIAKFLEYLTTGAFNTKIYETMVSDGKEKKNTLRVGEVLREWLEISKARREIPVVLPEEVL